MARLFSTKWGTLGNPILWTCKMYGLQLNVNSMQKLRFPSCQREKVMSLGPPGTARAQPCSCKLFLKYWINFNSKYIRFDLKALIRGMVKNFPESCAVFQSSLPCPPNCSHICGWLDLILKSIWGGYYISSSKDSLPQARVTAFMCGKIEWKHQIMF